MLWALFDILSVSSTSQYSTYVLECHGGFILTNPAPATSLTSTSGGLSEDSTTAYKQVNKSNFVLYSPNSPYSGIEIG